MVEVEGNSVLALIIVFSASIILFFYYYYCYYYHIYEHHGKNIPPGSLGFPVIGESWSFVKAQREDKGSEWIEKRVAMHGTVFKTSLMGCPTVVVTGRTGNKFVFSADDESLSVKQPPSIAMLVGKYNVLELTGPR